jgi:penicillin-binding protein 1A
VTVKTLQDIGVDLAYKYAESFGISTLVDDDKNLGLALGGLTQGVTNLELTGAYATIANGGVYHKPTFYTQVLDHEGNVLLDATETKDTRQVISEDTAWLLTDAMKDVLTSGTGTAAYFGTEMAQAGKSGTTTNNRDALFAGYTPYYTCVVWGGYDDNSKQSNTQYPKNLWRSVMKRIHEDLEEMDFTMPTDITKATVCRKSGLLPDEGVCSSDPRGSQNYTEYFAKGTAPTGTCDRHISVKICEESGEVAGLYCPEDKVVTRAYIVGAESGSGDAKYGISSSDLKTTCSIHDENYRAQEEEKKKTETTEKTKNTEKTEKKEKTEKPAETDEPDEDEELDEDEDEDIDEQSIEASASWQRLLGLTEDR